MDAITIEEAEAILGKGEMERQEMEPLGLDEAEDIMRRAETCQTE